MTTDLFPDSRQGLSTRRQLAACGLDRAGLQLALSWGTVVRVARSVYAVTPLAPVGRHLLSGGHRDEAYVARVRAVLLSMGPTAAASLRTAAVLWGFNMLVEPVPVHVVVTHGRSRASAAGAVVRRGRPTTVVTLAPRGQDPLAVTDACGTVLDCARELTVGRRW